MDEKEESDTRRALWEFLAHGDADHREWLWEAINAFFDGDPRPEPRGKGGTN